MPKKVPHARGGGGSENDTIIPPLPLGGGISPLTQFGGGGSLFGMEGGSLISVRIPFQTRGDSESVLFFSLVITYI